MAITVPPALRESVQLVLRSDEADLKAVLSAFLEAEPNVVFETWIGEVERLAPDLGSGYVKSLALLALSFMGFLDGETDRAKTIAEIAEAANALASQTEGDFPPGAIERFSWFVSEVLSSQPGLRSIQLAQLLAVHQDRTFLGATIASDARWVFSGDEQSGPYGALVVHVLQLRTLNNGEAQQLHVSLDREDLTTLRVAIDTALARDERIGDLLMRTGVRPLGERWGGE